MCIRDRAYTGAQIKGLDELIGRSVGGTANRLVLIGRERPDELRALLFEQPVSDYRIKVDIEKLQAQASRIRAANGDARPEVRFSLSHAPPRRLTADRLKLVVPVSYTHLDVYKRQIIGHSVTGRLLLVGFTERPGERLRLISARVTTKKERQDYEDYHNA